MIWKPTAEWLGEDAYLIGGGPSLTGYDWSRFHGRHTIGCNDAYLLGENVCSICVFGDNAWFNAHRKGLSQFSGRVVTNVPSLYNSQLPWLLTMRREQRGLYFDKLGWNNNTGAVAINLALILGAKRIFLFGYDMMRTHSRTNWHLTNIRPHATSINVYSQFVHDYKFVHKDWLTKFADREIVNVTDNSGLTSDIFPWMNPDKFWSR